MIQQVASAQLQQAGTQLLPVQQADSGRGTFQSLMKSASSIANKAFEATNGVPGKAGSVKNTRENPEDTAQKTEAEQVPFSVLSLLGQNFNTIRLVVSDAQTTGDIQANVNPVSIVQDSVISQGSVQSINLWQSSANRDSTNAENAIGTSFVPNTIRTGFTQGNAGNAFGAVPVPVLHTSQDTGQTANIFTAQPGNLPQGTDNIQTADFRILNAAQPVQISAPITPDSGRMVNSTDTSLQAFVSETPEQPTQQDSGSIFSVSTARTDRTVSEFSMQDGTFRTTLQKSEALSAKLKAAPKNEQRSSDFVGKIQDNIFFERKSDLTDMETASQNQGYTDLLRTENVIIPITTNPENTAKSACTQVTNKIEENYRAGKSEFTVDLYPKDLGKVSVKLRTQNGVLTVEISAANPKTQSMLLANTDEIKSILQSSVNQTVQVMQSQEQAWYEQSQNQSSAQQQEQQSRERERLFDQLQDDAATENFLSVMQHLISI